MAVLGQNFTVLQKAQSFLPPLATAVENDILRICCMAVFGFKK